MTPNSDPGKKPENEQSEKPAAETNGASESAAESNDEESGEPGE